MTKAEAKDVLIERLDFRVDSADPVSGIYFEDEHPIITLDNIKATQPEEGISDEDFDAYLLLLKQSVIYKVLADVVDRDELDDEHLNFYPSLFDNLISMQMQIRVINIILSSSRSNIGEAIAKNALQRIYFDLKGNKGSDKYPIADGIEHKYRSEIRRVKNIIGDQRKFKSITTR